MNSPISRRTLAKGAAWTVPAVVASAAVPAYASSTCAIPSTAKGYPYIDISTANSTSGRIDLMGTDAATPNPYLVGTAVPNGNTTAAGGSNQATNVSGVWLTGSDVKLTNPVYTLTVNVTKFTSGQSSYLLYDGNTNASLSQGSVRNYTAQDGATPTVKVTVVTKTASTLVIQVAGTGTVDGSTAATTASSRTNFSKAGAVTTMFNVLGATVTWCLTGGTFSSASNPKCTSDEIKTALGLDNCVTKTVTRS